MKKIFFFIHLPKTAGTSFRLALEKNDRVAMFYDYGEKSPESTPILIEKVRGAVSLKETSFFPADKLNVICGHVPYSKYAACVRLENVLAIMRNPVERVLSEYQHLTRHTGLSQSFTQFIQYPRQVDKQSKWLKGVDVSSGALIGLTSHYSHFLDLACQQLGISLEFAFHNQAPAQDRKRRLSISAGDIDKAFALNRKDLALFRSVANRFCMMLRKSGVQTTPQNGRKYSCRLDSAGRIAGWVGRREQECFFIVLTVNGQFRAVVGLDRPRAEIVRRGWSESEICGFSYPLSLLGASQGDEVAMTILGAPRFRKAVIVPPENGAP